MNESLSAGNAESSTSQDHLTAKWEDLVRCWRASGLSKSAYCKREQVNYHQMIYWSRKLCPINSDATKGRKPQSSSKESSGFVAVSVSPKATSVGLFLRLPNGIEVCGVDEQRIGRLIELVSAQ